MSKMKADHIKTNKRDFQIVITGYGLRNERYTFKPSLWYRIRMALFMREMIIFTRRTKK